MGEVNLPHGDVEKRDALEDGCSCSNTPWAEGPANFFVTCNNDGKNIIINGRWVESNANLRVLARPALMAVRFDGQAIAIIRPSA